VPPYALSDASHMASRDGAMGRTKAPGRPAAAAECGRTSGMLCGMLLAVGDGDWG